MGREGPVVQVKSTQGQGAAPVRSAATKRAATCPYWSRKSGNVQVSFGLRRKSGKISNGCGAGALWRFRWRGPWPHIDQVKLAKG